MNTNKKLPKRLISLILVCGTWAFLVIGCLFFPKSDFSLSERRKLEPFPTLTVESALDGSFMSKFDTYSQDNFPFRDAFRTFKALNAFYVFGKKDNNDIYIADGYAAKVEYPLNEKSVTNAALKFTKLYETFLKDKNTNIYLAIAPDKGYFLSEKNGYPAMDYEKLVSIMTEGMPYASYIDLFSHLDVTDYYKTDTHWRQEEIVGAASVIAEAMGAKPLGEYSVVTADVPFYGVYYGQAALPLPAEKIHYVTNDTLEKIKVENVETGKRYTGMIDAEKIDSKDPYEMFLSGAASVLYLENPTVKEKRELVVFRDSFGSSMVPLLVESYSKITVLDTRYIAPELLGSFAEFENTDVLFLYSTLILNQSEALR